MIKIIGKEEMPNKQKIFVISPHPDDSAIGAGGTIAILSKTNKIFNIVMCSGYRGVGGDKAKEEKIKIREEEAKKESAVLGTKPVFLNLDFYENYNTLLEKDIKKVELVFKKEKPSVVFLPKENDPHPTHKISSLIVKKVLLNYKITKWYYETPWLMFSWDEFNSAVSLKEEVMQQKLSAVSCHKSQLERTRFDIGAKALAELRAVAVPEQRISGYGKNPQKLGSYVEVFKIVA